MMNRFIEHIGNLYSIILTILTLFLGEHWILFMVLLLLNIIDTLTGWIKSRINNKENSMAGLKGIMKKLVQWILVLLAFVIPVCFKELGAVINIDLSILAFLGWYVLASLIINEYRSILENANDYLRKNGAIFLEIGYDQKEDVENLLKENKNYSEIKTIQDLSGNDRCVVAKVCI